MVTKQYTLKSTKGGTRLIGWKGKSIVLKKNVSLKINENDVILDHPSIQKKKNMTVTKPVTKATSKPATANVDIITEILGG